MVLRKLRGFSLWRVMNQRTQVETTKDVKNPEMMILCGEEDIFLGVHLWIHDLWILSVQLAEHWDAQRSLVHHHP